MQQYGAAGDRQIMIRLPQTGTAEQGTSLEQGSRQIEEALQKAGLPKFELLTRDIVGPVIGADLQRKRHLRDAGVDSRHHRSTSRVRFRPSFAIGAIVATFHDVFWSPSPSWRSSATTCR